MGSGEDKFEIDQVGKCVSVGKSSLGRKSPGANRSAGGGLDDVDYGESGFR